MNKSPYESKQVDVVDEDGFKKVTNEHSQNQKTQAMEKPNKNSESNTMHNSFTTLVDQPEDLNTPLEDGPLAAKRQH